jgi:hypothetical protein
VTTNKIKADKPSDADNFEQIWEQLVPGSIGLSRRSFLLSLGAMALSACGGSSSSSAVGTTTANAATTRALTHAAMPNTQFAQAVTGQPNVTTSGDFVHPGLLHTQSDFDRMAQMCNAQASPWYAGLQMLQKSPFLSLTRAPRPATIIYRGGAYPQNYSQLYDDIAAAYACALYWKVTGNTAYADKAVQIMNAWSSTLQGLGGDSNVDLAAGIYGYEFANVGEIMRGYSNWAAADFAAFQAMMRNIFYPINIDFLVRHNGTDITHYWANWDLCNIASIMAIGVLCDDRAIFNQAVNYFMFGMGNGAIAQAVYYLHPGHLGQWQESGRDQGHATLGIALGGAICEMAWNQGIDFFGYDNNRFLAGAEYIAKSNLLQPGTQTYYTVPYVPYVNSLANQTVFSTGSQGIVRPCWALVYNHYVNRKGLAAPWSTQFALNIQPEGGGGQYGSTSGGFDQLGYGTLTCTLPSGTPASAPSGLTAHAAAGNVVLSWWGVSNGTSYNVKRSSTSGGPYTLVQSGITDPLTYTDTPSAGTWYYVVSATTPAGESADSAEAAVNTSLQLLAYLPFSEASGTTASDASGNGNNGTLVGSVSHVAGRSGNAIALDGTSGYVSLPNDIVLNLSDFTIAAWVYCNTNTSEQRVFDFGSGIGRYMMLSPNGGGVLRFAITLDLYYGEINLKGSAPLPIGRWQHLAVTLSASTATLYLNGNAISTVTNVPFAPWRLGHTGQNWIGRSQYPGDPYFNGMIEDFRLYNGAMSADQVAALAQS